MDTSQASRTAKAQEKAESGKAIRRSSRLASGPIVWVLVILGRSGLASDWSSPILTFRWLQGDKVMQNWAWDIPGHAICSIRGCRWSRPIHVQDFLLRGSRPDLYAIS